eukprot:m.238390 g.238390  ORF g.238390 m.238390 type:complete len:625 (-) comp18967_c1_seq1:63-1937(-)
MSQADFSAKTFSPDQYVAGLCSSAATLSQLTEQRGRIGILAERNSQALKANVYKNFTQYVDAAKEISKLEAEMYELGNLLGEQNGLLRGISELLETGVAPGMEQRADRVATLEQVEGLDISNPLVTGACLRHGQLTHVSPTMTTEELVHAFMTQRALVIAKQERHRLLLLSLTPFSELSVRDVADSKEFVNVFAVGGPSGDLFFSASSLGDKRSWLEELSRASSPPDAKQRASDAGVEAEEDEDWWVCVPEDLDVFIAQRAFENAVDLVERTQSRLDELEGKTSHDELVVALNSRKRRLTKTLSQELERPAWRRNALRSLVLLMLRLGESEQASKKYLQNWSDAFERDLRKLKMEASIELYIHKLCRIFFSAVRASCHEFDYLFDNASKSRFIAWAQRELGRFSQVFSRQVLETKSPSFGTIAECVEVATTHCRALQEDGLDLEFLLWRLLHDKVIEAIDEAGRNWIANTAHHLVEDTWRRQDFSGVLARKRFLSELQQAGVHNPDDYLEGNQALLFEATSAFCTSCHEFVQSAVRLLCPVTSSHLIDWMARLFLLFVNKLCEHFDGREIFSTNAVFIMDFVLPAAKRKLEARHGAPLTVLGELEQTVANAWQQGISEDGISHF